MWEIGHALRVFHDAAELFEFPEAGRIAEEILQNGQANLPRNHMTHIDSGCRRGPVDKGADLDGDIDVPMMSSRPTSRAARPIRPVHDGTETWFWELSQIFQSHSEEEAFEGEFFIYVQTWYIDHERHRVCRRPRPVRLDQHWITWLDDLRHEWRDVLAPDVSFSVHIIKPRPPQFRHHGYACHLLIEQNRPRGNAAGILTSLIEGPTNDGITQGAFAVPRFLRKQDIIDFLEVEPFCGGRRCTAYHDQVPIQLVQATEVHSGFSICLRITSQELQRPYAPHDRPQFFEDLDLMQRSITIHGPQNRAIDIPNEAETNCDPFVPPFQFNAHAIAFQPAPPILRAQSEFTQDLHLLWSASASSWENEVPAAHVLTWFVDHRQVPPICLDSRQVTLHDNVQDWETIIKNAWRDSLDATQPIELYVVQPDPPMMEPSIFAHVVLVQAPRDNWVSNLVTVFDSFISSRERNLMRLVVTTHEHFSLHNIALACGYGFIGSAPIDPVAFQGWVNRHPLEPGRLWPGRSGSEITLQVLRQVVLLPAHLQPQDAQFLLQTRSVRRTPGPKTTDGSLTDGDSLNSQDRIIIDLDAALFSSHLVPVRLIHASDCDTPAHFPDHVLVPDGFHAADIEKALDEFGLSYHAYVLHATGFSFVTPISWSSKHECWHLIYFPLHYGCKEEIILHKGDHEPTIHEHMKFLHAIGFTRAVILDIQQPRCRVLLVQYHNNTPALEETMKVQRTAAAWPPPQPIRSHAAMYRQPKAQDGPTDHLLTWNVTFDDLHDFFHSGNDILCPWHSHLDLPEIVRNVLPADASHEGHVESFSTFDRLIVYTDGSSKSHNRRKAPLWVQEFDIPDAWAFVVLGERYGTQSTDSEIVLLGWHSQQVLYESHLPHFLGTDAIGSEFAEREALFWAGIWRLGINSSIPTVFRTDSSTADQATGRVCCHSQHPTFIALRSIFQALQAGMKQEDLRVEHVAGHAGDPWNELADFLAKTEAKIGHKLVRQQINLHKWTPVLSYLWMIFDQHAGLPPIVNGGFAIPPPNPPSPVTDVPEQFDHVHSTVRTDFAISLASLNVGSLFTGPDGFAGKLKFLRDQMKSLHLNMLGLQEARSPAGLSLAEDVIRLSSGAQQGRHGVELWINTKQPFCYAKGKPQFLRRSHIQVVQADHRRLIVRIACPLLQCMVAVLHAPQSGRSLEIRKEWWEETHNLLQSVQNGVPLFAMIDANAKSGPCSPPIVFENDDASSTSTALFLDFLTQHEMCLPSTGSMHQGAHATWTAPDGMTHHRVDFVAVSQAWSARCTHSSLLPELDTGNAHEDHIAVALQLCWQDLLPNGAKHQVSKGRHNRHKIGQNRQHIDLTLVSIADWKVDIETQVQQVNCQLAQVLTKACPLDKTCAKKPFIDQALWHLRAQKLHLRKRLQTAQRQRSLLLLRCIFQYWQQDEVDETAHCQHEAYVTSILCAELKLHCRYYCIARTLKMRLRHAKVHALQAELRGICEKTAAGEILHRIRPFIGPSNPKKIKRACLPFVKSSTGHICQTPQEAQNRWIEFFQQMENGTRMSLQDYRSGWAANLRHFLQVDSLKVPLQELPTLVELEAAFHRVAVGKAVGADDVPPEVCRYKATEMARIAYAIMMKTCLYGQEAVEHKCGRLAIAWKNKGDPADCAAHRSLLVSIHFGKTIHRALTKISWFIHPVYASAAAWW